MPNALLRSLPILGSIDEWLRQRKRVREQQRWEATGRTGAAPHLIKQRAIAQHAKRFGTRIMVETGTFYGDMCHAMRNHFDQIYTIELSDKLYADAICRFRNTPNITPLHGDSGVVIKDVLDKLDQPALFWLDGHYSAGPTARGRLDTPVSEELDHILAHRVHNHVMLIDDARCFTGEGGYPVLAELQQHLLEQRPDWGFEVENDCIRFTPPLPGATP